MANKKVPMRQCVGCRELKGKKDLIRIIRTENDEIQVDVTGKKNGRGAYICPNQDCLDKAVKNKGIEKSLKMSVPKEIFQEFMKEMETIESR